MKKQILLVFFLCFSLSSFAKIWRVNNNPYASADFETIQEAHNAASPGDTIFVEKGRYSGATISKKINLFGVGYDDNFTKESLHQGSTYMGSLIFSEGSKYSVASNFYGNGSVTIEENNVKIIDTKIKYLKISSNIESFQCQNSIILQSEQRSKKQIMFSNCFIAFHSYTNYNVGGIYEKCILSGPNQNAQFSNCIFLSSVCFNKSYKNTINNSLCLEELPQDNNEGADNITGKYSTDVIFQSTEEGSNYYRLKTDETNPALTCSDTGGEVGIYGGNTPFVYGGVNKQIPVITELTAPVTVENSIQFNVKATVEE